MVDLITVIAAAGGGGATWITQGAVAWFKGRSDRAEHRDSLDATLEQHRDKLTFDLLAAAREEVAAARVEAAEMRSLQLRLTHFEEALDHVQALLDASPDDRAAVERCAQQFLVRMKRLADARGAIVNEAQVQASKGSLVERGEL